MFSNPYFGVEDLVAKEQNRVVHLGGLHFKATRDEIEYAAELLLPGVDCIFY
jgi:hypothetical protein